MPTWIEALRSSIMVWVWKQPDVYKPMAHLAHHDPQDVAPDTTKKTLADEDELQDIEQDAIPNAIFLEPNSRTYFS